jgi:catechol 2,3-dioxygenase
MRIGPPVLRVRNIDTAMAFYENSLGLQVNRSYKDNSPGGDYYDDVNPIYEVGFKHNNISSFSSSFSSYDPLLLLKHDPNAKKKSSLLHSAGLFHFAILVPDRKSLASTYLALKNSGIQYDGFADYLVSESLYLRDPEDNGIEIYRDRPANEWPRDTEGHIMMDTLPLDWNSLLAEMNNNNNKEEQRNNAKAFPTGARIGHIHLRVTNLERSIKFYHEKIGLDITVDWRSMGAAFLSAGGYHHHIGMNTWHSLNGGAHMSGEAGLEYFTIIIPDRSFVNTLALRIQHSSTTTNSKQIDGNQLLLLFSDPDGIQLLIRSQ